MSTRLSEQLQQQLLAEKHSYSVERLKDGGLRVEMFMEPEPKPFWRFDKDDNLIETNQ